MVHRKTLVLDLDETLIHSHHDAMPRNTVKPGTPHDFTVKVTIDRHPVRFFVHKRPHVDFFLDVVSVKIPTYIYHIKQTRKKTTETIFTRKFHSHLRADTLYERTALAFSNAFRFHFERNSKIKQQSYKTEKNKKKKHQTNTSNSQPEIRKQKNATFIATAKNRKLCECVLLTHTHTLSNRAYSCRVHICGYKMLIQ